MFVRITTSGPRQYVKLVEAYRDAAGVSRQRVIATLGRLETVRAGSADAVVNGLLRVTGKPTMEAGSGEMAFESPLQNPDSAHAAGKAANSGRLIPRVGSMPPSSAQSARNHPSPRRATARSSQRRL